MSEPARLAAALRCGARRKRDGQPCQSPAMVNGRCRLHGGASTGPRTEAGRKRCGEKWLVNGLETREIRRERSRQMRILREMRAHFRDVKRKIAGVWDATDEE